MSDFAEELYKLHELSGAEFIVQLKTVTARAEFHPLEDEPAIFTVGGEKSEDYVHLMNAAQKAVAHGYRVFVLPNPKGKRTADFIFERKGVYKMFELKTISGKSTIENRLMESIGQTNRVLLNITSDYNPGTLARSIKKYFESNRAALEVLVFKGRKTVSITRDLTLSTNYYQIFMRRFYKGQ